MLAESGYDLTILSVTLTMIGKFASTASFGTVILYAPEIYPTNLRYRGLPLCIGSYTNSVKCIIIMVALCNTADHYIFAL